MDGFERDAVMPLEGSIFEPKTPFMYQGTMHNPAREGSGVNHGYQHGADSIELSDEMVKVELGLGLHESGRPNSAVLNHCLVKKASPAMHSLLVEFYGTVKKRKSSRRRVRVEAKKKSETTIMKVEDERFGVDAPQTLTPPVKNKGGRPKGSTTKKKALKKLGA